VNRLRVWLPRLLAFVREWSWTMGYVCAVLLALILLLVLT
jgi:hypothetical protein